MQKSVDWHVSKEAEILLLLFDERPQLTRILFGNATFVHNAVTKKFSWWHMYLFASYAVYTTDELWIENKSVEFCCKKFGVLNWCNTIFFPQQMEDPQKCLLWTETRLNKSSKN